MKKHRVSRRDFLVMATAAAGTAGPPVSRTAEDLAAGMEFDDVIGYSTWGSDIPDPQRPSVNPDRLRIHGGKPIPYRIMVPQPIENLICPGRAVSTDRIVLGSIRVMSPCMAMGKQPDRQRHR